MRGVGPCGQYRLNKEDVSKGSAFEGDVMMLRAFATETSTDMFDHTTIEAQPSGSDQGARRGQVRTHALKDTERQFGGMQDTLDDGLTQDLDGAGKTDAIGVQALALGRPQHQAAHGIMRQEQGVEFLQDQSGASDCAAVAG
jgi:hypothetical protein